MALEEHEIKQLEERFDRLENKLRATFAEVERRFEEVKAQPLGVEDRIQELEDLILMMQLEITKIKDRTSITTEFMTPDTPGMAERLNRLEEALSIKLSEPESAKLEEGEEPLELRDEEEPAAGGDIEEAKEVQEAKEKRHPKSLLEEVQQILST